MARTRIKRRLIWSFSAAILIPSLCASIVAVVTIRRQVNRQAEARVLSELEAAREIYRSRLGQLRDALRIHAKRPRVFEATAARAGGRLLPTLEEIQRDEGFDLLLAVDERGRVIASVGQPGRAGDDLSEEPLVSRVLAERQPVSGTQVMTPEELTRDAPALARRAYMEITPTPRAERTERTHEARGLLLRAAAPVIGADGQLVGALAGGLLLNRDEELVDKVRTTVFKGEIYRDRQVGTATIFLGDVRISTNVRNDDGTRAVSTRASAEVARAVLEREETWQGRAFVVNDWYISAYAPIRDLAGRTVGMLYVGTLERPYRDNLIRMVMVLLAIIVAGMALASLVGMAIAGRIAEPVHAMAIAAERVARGDYSQKVRARTGDEIEDLADSFNRMTTDLARAEQELRRWGEQLERKVEERTAELEAMQAQMLQSDKLASLGSLVAGVAHEINNPNTFIRGNIAIVAEALSTILPILDEEAQRRPDLEIARLPYAQFREHIEVLVADIGQGADKIMNIVSDLRKFARRDEGLLAEDVAVNPAVESCLRLVHNQIKRVAQVELELADDLPTFRGNVQKIEQVLVNVIINAAQAIEEKGPPGHIRIRTFLDAERRVCVRVADDGAGMSDATRRRIFDPFFTTKRARQGTGLGLSIAYGIISEHRGTIEVSSTPGVGSEFRIAVPASASPVAEAAG